MEKTVNININIHAAREMLILAGFSQAWHASDEEIFRLVLNRISCYGTTCTIIEDERKSETPQQSSNTRLMDSNFRDPMAPRGGNK